MTENAYIDFDQAWAERSAPPLVVRMYGRDWELPGVLPAGAPLKVARYMANGRTETDLTSGEILDLAADLFPRDTLDAWLGKGLDVDKLAQVILWVIGQYGGGGAEGEAKAPATGAPGSSSPAGDSSKPTSPASTDSTSPEP